MSYQYICKKIPQKYNPIFLSRLLCIVDIKNYQILDTVNYFCALMKKIHYFFTPCSFNIIFKQYLFSIDLINS